MTSRPLELALEASFERLPPLCRQTSVSRSRVRTEPIRWAAGRPVSPGRRSRCRWRSRLCAAISHAPRTWSSKPSPNPITRHPSSCGPCWASRRTPRGGCKPSSRNPVTRPPWSNHVDSGAVSPHLAKRNGPWSRQARFAAQLPSYPRRGGSHRPDAPPHHRPAVGTCGERHCRQGWLGSGSRSVTTWSGNSGSCPRNPGSGAWRWRPKPTTACSRPE